MVSLALYLLEIDKLRNVRMRENVVAAISPRKPEPEAFHKFYHIREPDIFDPASIFCNILCFVAISLVLCWPNGLVSGGGAFPPPIDCRVMPLTAKAQT